MEPEIWICTTTDPAANEGKFYASRGIATITAGGGHF